MSAFPGAAADFVNEALRLFAINYAVLGFRVMSYRIADCSLWDGFLRVQLRLRILCPCGREETAAFATSVFPDLVEDIGPQIVASWVDRGLQQTASRAHLEEDVAEGRLPPSAVDGAVYEGRLIR